MLSGSNRHVLCSSISISSRHESDVLCCLGEEKAENGRGGR